MTRWTQEDPGAGDTEAVRQLAGRFESAAGTLDHVRSRVLTCTAELVGQGWSGAAADAWQSSGEQCAQSLDQLVGQLEPLGPALRDYATRVEEIAEEAAAARRRKTDAQLDLSRLNLQASTVSRSASPVAQRGWSTDRDDARYAVTSADQLLAELAEDRSTADSRVCAEIASTQTISWPTTTPAPAPVITPVITPVARPVPVGPSHGDPLDGAYHLMVGLKDGLQLTRKTTALVTFYRSATAAITARAAGRMRAGIRLGSRASASLRTFVQGPPGGGLLGKVIGARAAGLIGKAFLPMTFVSGLNDMRTGGGYEGARGWATRGFGAVGVAGVAALTFFSLTPLGLTIAGAAVLAYGAWSLGNYLWDNREAIGNFLSSAGSTIKDGWEVAGRGVSRAAGWAKDAVGTVADRAADIGGSVLNVLSFAAW